MIGPWLEAPVLLAIPIGLAFGFLLERGGLASARTIADQLAFRDFTVVKVMLVTIVTAMLGVFWATRLGWLDMATVGVPATDLLPQGVGAVVFGAGFAVAALCPGTACAAVGAGRGDGLAVVGGLLVGTLGTMLAWPELGMVAERASREGALLPADLGLPTGIVVAAITVGGLGLLPILTRWEGVPPGPPAGRRPLGAAAIAAALLAIPASRSTAPASLGELESIGREITREADHVDPLELAEWIRDGRPGLRVLDLRDGLDDRTYRIPGAEWVPLAAVPRLAIAPDETVVLYTDGGTHAAQAWVLLRSVGKRNILVLHDGLAGWEDEVLAPAPPVDDDPADAVRYRRAQGLSRYFGGLPSSATPGASATGGPAPRPRRNRC